MSNLVIKDIEVVSTEEATNVSKQDQAMTLGGCCCCCPPPPPPPCDPKLVGCGSPDDSAFVF